VVERVVETDGAQIGTIALHKKLICAIAKIGFFNEWAGNQSDLAVRGTLSLVCFRGLAMDFAMTASGWIVLKNSPLQWC
jgi:hypothetical protein